MTFGQYAEPDPGRPRSTGQVREVSCTQNETSAGDTDTEVNELAAIPTGMPSTTAHTAVTPDGKQAKARRSCSRVRKG